MPEGEASGTGVDAVQFGMMIGKMDQLIGRFDRFEREIKENYVTKTEHSEVNRRLDVLEQIPGKKRAEVVAWIACIFAGCSGIGTTVGLILHH